MLSPTASVGESTGGADDDNVVRQRLQQESLDKNYSCEDQEQRQEEQNQATAAVALPSADKPVPSQGCTFFLVRRESGLFSAFIIQVRKAPLSSSM